jgi:hypothetical protein
MFDSIKFYEAYLYDYHIIKIKQLYHSLNNIDEYISTMYNNQEPYIINDKNLKERIELQLRIDMRMTMFHSIETLFELIFALIKINGEERNEDELIQMLSNSDFKKNYSEIKKISIDKNYLNLLDDIILIKGFKTTKLDYLFYRILINSPLLDDSDFQLEYNESKNSIKEGLNIVADEFNNRDDYNAFKHSLRIINSIDAIYIAKANNLNDNIKFDFSNSFIYLKNVSKNDIQEYTTVTKTFDTLRDYNITDFCSKLIFQIIRYRHIAINLGKIEMDSGVPILLYPKNVIEDGFKHGKNSARFEIKQSRKK